FNRQARWFYKPGRQFLAQDDKYAYLVEPRVVPNGKGWFENLFHDKHMTVQVIVAIDKQTGRKAFESKHADFSVFGTNTKDDTIYVGYAGGEILAVKPVIKAGRVGE